MQEVVDVGMAALPGLQTAAVAKVGAKEKETAGEVRAALAEVHGAGSAAVGKVARVARVACK